MVPEADWQEAAVPGRVGFGKLGPAVLAGMGVEVTFLRPDAKPVANTDEASARPATLVPKTAVRSENGQNVLFVVRNDGRVERRAVRTGGEDGPQLEIVAGVTRGEQVVAPLPPVLKDGAQVTVKP